MEDMINMLFSEEYEIAYQDKLRRKQTEQLKKVIQIKFKVGERDKFRAWEAFVRWKRHEYLAMLGSLHSYRETLREIYA